MENVSNATQSAVQAVPQVTPAVIPILAELQQMPVVSAPNFAAFIAEKEISFVREYDPKVTAIEGYRHSVIRYRNTDGKSTKTAQMVTIPALKLPTDYAVFSDGEPGTSLAKMLLDTLEDAQDSMIRVFIDGDGKNKVSNIGWSLLTLEQVIANYNAVRVSVRLTKEQIEAWAKIAFVAACNQRADQISEASKHTPEQNAKQRAGTLNAYADLAMKLAAPVPNIGQNQAIALKNMLTVAKLDDDMAKALFAKLEVILNPKVVENGDL